MVKITVETLRQQATQSWDGLSDDFKKPLIIDEQTLERWAGYYDRYESKEGFSIGVNRTILASKIYLIARDQGIEVAMWWKLANG